MVCGWVWPSSVFGLKMCDWIALLLPAFNYGSIPQLVYFINN